MILALLLATLVPEKPPEPFLWLDLQAGMPKSEVKARYPKYRAEIMDECPVQVLSTYKKGGLQTVILVNTIGSPSCADRIRSKFQQAYGSPQTVRSGTEATGFAVGGGYATTFSHNRKDETWIVGPVRILFVTFPGSNTGYNIIFSKVSEGLASGYR